MTTNNPNAIPIIIFALICISGNAVASNLTCYQCIRETNTECLPNELLPCPAISDRCVTHISKNGNNGFFIKRECGLGPCGFDDDMVNKGLGFGSCDRSRDEYFCIFCCRSSGCNKSSSQKITAIRVLLIISPIVHILSRIQ